MTVQIYSSPGTSTWTSAKFSATVNGSPAYVYGYARTTSIETVAWTAGDAPEQSWFTFGTDETTTVVVSLVDATPITSAIVYPKDAGVSQEIAGGVLTLTVPADVRLRVEINGDRAEALHIFASPPKATVPGTTTNWTSLGQTVTVDTVNDRLVFAGVHGFTAGQKITMKSTGTNPGDASGAFSPNEQFFITEVDGLEISIGRVEGDSLDLTTAGSGTIKVWPAFYTSTSSALYFGTGEHDIAQLFALADDVTVYIDGGAVVTGSFDLRGCDGVEVKGPGVLSGTFADYDAIDNLAFSTRQTYSMFYGYDGAKFLFDNAVQGITVVAAPFYLNYEGVWSWRNVHLVNPWTLESDGFRFSGQSAPSRLAEAYRCFAFCGDDACSIIDDYQNTTVTETFLVCSSNACLQGYYWPNQPDLGYTVDVVDCHAMHIGVADNDSDTLGLPVRGGNTIIKSWIDGWSTESLKGHFNVSIRGLRVWGPMASRLMSIGNRRYPYNDALDREQYGQLNGWEITDLVTEQAPGQISLILGRDASNAPAGITFSGVVLGGATVYRTNYTEYFDVTPFAVAIEWDDEPVVVDPSEDFVPEDGTGLATANVYCSVAFADTYFGRYANPSAWTSSTTAQKEMALRVATAYIEERYQGRWKGQLSTSTQALSHPRYGMVDQEGRQLSSTAVHARVKEAACEIALRYRQGVDLRPDAAPGEDGIGQSSITVGPISIQDVFRGSSALAPDFPVVAQKLRPLLTSTGSRLLVGITR